MRPFKFRVYNKKSNKWIHGPHKNNSLDGVNLFGECILLGGFMDKTSLEDLNECEILQYTGLKDKNGRDIFEGDILKVKNYDGWFDQEGFYNNSVVKWDERSRDSSMGETESCGYFYIPKDREVIGNVFENPELIPQYKGEKS